MSLPAAIRRTPSLDRWLRFSDDGMLVVYTGKVEIGQGIKTALAMIAAEELDVALARVRVQTADTELTPNEFVTAGSLSIEDSGSALRVASAAARSALMKRAAELLGVAMESLRVIDGLITSEQTNQQTDYWTLAAAGPFAIELTDLPDLPDVKHPDTYKVVGRKTTRLDLLAKLRGQGVFVHDMQLPGMLHGRLVKPPFMTSHLLHCPDTVSSDKVIIVRDGGFIGVVADLEEVAITAAEQLHRACKWQSDSLTPAPESLFDYLRNNVSKSLPIVDGLPTEEELPAVQPPEDAVQTLTASYRRPYQMHAAMGPSAALAQFDQGKLTVYSHSQGVELLKLALADALNLEAADVHVIHREGAGCYGHNGADDVSLDAALLAMAVAPRAVLAKWSRSDEHGFEPYAPASVIDMQASLNADGAIIDWRHDAYSFSHNGRPRPSKGYSNLQSAWWRAEPILPPPRQPAMMAEVGIHRNMQPIYAFPRQRLFKHFVPNSPLRTSSLRSLGAFVNVFAIESFIDEVAHATNSDPIAFRLAHLVDDRGRQVLEALRDTVPAPSAEHNAGRGIAFARYKNRQTFAAVLVDLHVADDGRVTLDRAFITADAGLVIDPDGLTNQLEGGFIQAASWTLKEEVSWDHECVTSRDWDSYPILRFSEIPDIATILLARPDEPALGAGEASTGPTPAAIANAIFDAVGVRVRDLPFTPDRVRAAAFDNPE